MDKELNKHASMDEDGYSKFNGWLGANILADGSRPRERRRGEAEWTLLRVDNLTDGFRP